MWSMVCPVMIEEESVRQNLLQEIAYMWVTTRGHSKAKHMKLRRSGRKTKHSVSKESDLYAKNLQQHKTTINTCNRSIVNVCISCQHQTLF